jgi:LuxR family maltose regulon positive regulatory protein
LTEVRAVDLRFTLEEAAAFLTETMGLPLTAEQVSVVEYLVEEVLDRQAEETQRFLLHTSVLDRMCAPLCDSLLNSEKERASYDQSLDTRFQLEQLARANLFLI